MSSANPYSGTAIVETNSNTMALNAESNPTTIKANDDMATVAKIDELLRPISKYKKRAYCTSMTTHLPILNEIIEEMKSGARDHVSVVLLGDSMLERMTTTGLSRDAPALSCDAEWPPRHLLNYDELKTVLKKRNPNRLRTVLNLGVGGSYNIVKEFVVVLLIV
ncbi:hypothetical protein V8F06_013385 [Rhypophila decipiens]